MHTFFMTGYPGFLAQRLLRQLLNDHGTHIDHIYLLVLPSLEGQATQDIHYFAKKHSLNPGMFSILPGDITQPDLGLNREHTAHLIQTVTHVFHLAAIYDLAVPETLAWNVNVEGTRHVNNWVQTISSLKRYVYVSTAYVSGRREGDIYEHELSCGQTFKNHYERTKFEAERQVDHLKSVIPLTIIRPGIVKGHAETGETIKFDGLYFMLNFLDSIRHLPVLPYLGDGKAEGNFVPADYVLKATSFLSMADIGVGKTYHLTDPNPYKMRDIYKLLAYYYLGRTPSGHMPLPMAKIGLSFSLMRKYTGTEQEALDYFTTEARFDCSQAQKDLQKSDITCPDLVDTIPSMVSFYRRYKDDYARQINII
ncbi:Alcohol-forming fatty acyl-CoA reductase [Lentibacillus sp. JNUCC-1]|uniref:SDR family oxidoreductase n=1 Tax=Lentibacillus sp. JNUCC-1 TaxID=2654513 RepID=UPI0012E73E9C|nr:SDR family oxidoreductase [Lentibacillus sp. JNUCC-1]MUV36676.1 Alcohol-forming fatty acyl-CoA reductase [Lentibacillus sp. JNUCC-1]